MTVEFISASFVNDVDLGAELISIRGYDNFNDAIDYRRYLLPLVHSELAHRAATGTAPHSSEPALTSPQKVSA